MSIFGSDLSSTGNDLTTLEGIEDEVMNELYYGSRFGAIEMLQHRDNYRDNRLAYKEESEKLDRMIKRHSTIFNRRKLRKMKADMELVVVGLSDEQVKKIMEYQGIQPYEI